MGVSAALDFAVGLLALDFDPALALGPGGGIGRGTVSGAGTVGAWPWVERPLLSGIPTTDGILMRGTDSQGIRMRATAAIED